MFPCDLIIRNFILNAKITGIFVTIDNGSFLLLTLVLICYTRRANRLKGPCGTGDCVEGTYSLPVPTLVTQHWRVQCGHVYRLVVPWYHTVTSVLGSKYCRSIVTTLQIMTFIIYVAVETIFSPLFVVWYLTCHWPVETFKKFGDSLWGRAMTVPRFR